MKLLFVGHSDFGNRGCEALIRSTSKLLREAAPETVLLCPSRNIPLDQRHWPEAERMQVRFVAPSLFPAKLRWWSRASRLFPPLRTGWRPRFRPDRATLANIEEADAVIVSGGDILGLEYHLASLYHWMGLIDAAIDRGKPVHLWAASVGPFTREPAVERRAVAHLRRYASISVRESATHRYLTGLGVANVRLVADPAFVMEPEPHQHGEVLFAGARDGVLGFNVSPLVRGYLSDDESKARFDAEVVGFLRHVVERTGLSVLLVPHVDPQDGSERNSDSAYMQRLLAQAKLPPDRLAILPGTLNAAQLKHALGRCRFFIGARTHATIGAMSQGVPTISIAYSVKAVGINRDLFGDEDVVLPTPQVSQATLTAALDRLFQREDAIRAILAERIPIWRERAREAAIPVLGRVA